MAECCFQLHARTGLDLFAEKKIHQTDFLQLKKNASWTLAGLFFPAIFIETELKPSTQAMSCSMLFKYKQVAGQGHSV